MMDTVPAIAKIAELRLGVRLPSDDVRRGVSMRAPYAAARRDMWAGQIMWAGLSRGDMQSLVAFFESLDGRVTPFGVPLAAGFASQFVAGSASKPGTLAEIPTPGTDNVRISVTGSPTLQAGTLVGLGSLSGAYQMCEILQDVVADGATPIFIAPRIRVVIGTTSCVLGSVTGAFRLATDKLDGLEFLPAYGTLTVDVEEAL